MKGDAEDVVKKETVETVGGAADAGWVEYVEGVVHVAFAEAIAASAHGSRN